MLSDSEYRISNLTEPLLDVDVSENGRWVAISTSRVVSDGFEFSLQFKPRFPRIRILDEERSLIVDSRTNSGIDNGFILDRNGTVLTSFYAGDAVEDVVVCEDYIVISYFDEAFGGTGVESNGISIFDREGSFRFGYRTEFGTDAVDVFDCHACTRVGRNRVMFYCYTEFPLVVLDVDNRTQQVFHPPGDVAGSHAISKAGNRAYFHGPYDDKQGIYEWMIGGGEAARVGAYTSDLRGLSGGTFLATGTSGYTIVTISDY